MIFSDEWWCACEFVTRCGENCMCRSTLWSASFIRTPLMPASIESKSLKFCSVLMLPTSSGSVRGLNDYLLAGYLSKKGSVMGLWTQHYYVLTADDLLCYKKSTSVDLFAMLRNARETSLCKLRRITPLSLFVSCTPSAGDPCTLQLQEREGRTTLLRAASSADAQLWQRAFSTLIAKIKAALDASAALIASGVAADAQPHSLARVESFPSTINPPSLTPSSQPGRSPSLQPLPHPTMPSVPTPSSSVAISSAPMSSAAATNTSAASAPPYAPATATGRVTVVGASAASSVHVTVAPTAAASSSAASAGRRPAARPADGHVAGSVPPPPVMLRPLRSVQTVAVDPAEQVTPFFLRPFLTALSSAVAVSAAAASSAAPLTLSAHAAALPRARTVAEGVPFRRRVALGSLPPHARVLLTLGDGSVVELDEHTLRCGVGADGGVVAKGARPSPTAAAAPAGGSDSEADGGTAGSGRSSSASSVTTRYQRWFPANDPYHQFSVLVRWHRTLPAPRAVLRNARPLLPGLVVPALALLSAVAFAVCGRPDAPLLSYLLPLLTVALASQVITEKAALASLLAHEYTVTVLTLGANDAQHTALSATPASGITAGAPTTVTAPAPGTGTGDNGDGDGLSHPRNRTLSSLGRLDSIDFSSSPIPAAREIRFRSGSSAVRGAAAPGASPAQRGFGRKTSVAEGPLWVGEGGADGGDGAVGDDGEAVAGDVHRTGTLLLSPGAAAQGAPAGASTGDQDAGRLRRRGPAPTRAAAAADGAPARAVTASGDTATEESTESSESDIDDAADAASMLALPLGGGPRAGPTVMAPPAHQGHAHVHQEGGLGHARTRSESRADEHKRILREISRTGAFSSARPAAGAAGVRVSGSGGAPHGTVREEEPGHESGASTDADDWDESANELQAELSADNISAVCGKDKPVTAKSSSRIDAGAAAESNEFPYPSLNRCGSASEFPGLCKGKLRQLGPVHQEAWGGWSEPEDDIIKVRTDGGSCGVHLPGSFSLFFGLSYTFSFSYGFFPSCFLGSRRVVPQGRRQDDRGPAPVPPGAHGPMVPPQGEAAGRLAPRRLVHPVVPASARDRRRPRWPAAPAGAAAG
jgi:hypothetical protein